MGNGRGWAVYEWALLALCAGLVSWQLFVPPSLGLADNNDYAKLIGRVCLGGEHPLFEYVGFQYHYAAEYCWNSGLITSAVLPLSVALTVAKPFSGSQFDVRWLGAVYAVLFLLVFAAVQRLVRGLRPIARVSAPAAVLVVFCSASYIPSFDSFYFDTTSYVFLWCGILLCVRLLLCEKVTTWDYLAALAGVVVFETSKSQHTALALPLIACFWLRLRTRHASTLATAPRCHRCGGGLGRCDVHQCSALVSDHQLL